MHREVATLGRGVPEARLLQGASFSAYDFDDALHVDRGSGPRAMFPKSLIAERSVGSADRVIAANDVLAEWASKLASDVVVIPSCIDPDQYRQRDSGDRPLSVVWLGSESTSMFLLEIAEPLRRLAQRHRFVLRAIGASPTVQSIGSFVEVVPWHLGIDADLCDLGDVGIMPLPDTPFAEGKSAYKLLQYSAAGLPAVVSPIGASSSIAQVIGADVAQRPSDWVEHLGDLLSDASLRMVRGRLALERVRGEFSYDRWLGPFRSALGLPPL